MSSFKDSDTKYCALEEYNPYKDKKVDIEAQQNNIEYVRAEEVYASRAEIMFMITAVLRRSDFHISAGKYTLARTFGVLRFTSG